MIKRKNIHIFVDDPDTIPYFQNIFSYFVSINCGFVFKIFMLIFCSNYANLHLKIALTLTTKFDDKGVLKNVTSVPYIYGTHRIVLKVYY